MAALHPAWDFEESTSEAEIDYARLQPFELAQASLRPRPSKRSSTQHQHLSSGLALHALIPAGPNQPLRERSRSFGAALGHSPPVDEDVRRGTTSPATAAQQQQDAQAPASGGSPMRPRPRSSSTSGLNRSQTLLSHSASPLRSSQELSRLLAKSPSSRKLGGGADGRAEDDARLEAGRRKARVTIDVDLEREILVEGGDVKGTMVVVVRPGPKKEGPVHVGLGKIRLVGFEDVPSHEGRHIFYHHSATLPLFALGSTHRSSLFAPTPGTHHPSNAGAHPVPFHLPLPLTDFPRGPHRSSSSAIRYILIASLSLFFPFTGKSSIAHFYRNVTVYPKIDPARVLGGAGGAVENARSFGSPGGKGVELGVKVGKAVWVAGMSCWVDISMYNGTSKKIKSLTVQLWQTTVLYHPSLTSTRPSSMTGNVDPGSTSTKHKKVAETTLAEAQASGKGLITGKGWFTGCAPMTAGAWSSSLVLPPDALSIPRGRLIEVRYAIRVCVDARVFVEVPVRIVNFISIDPPPSTYRAPVQSPVVQDMIAVAPAAAYTEAAHDSPKSTYTDGVIGYDTISRPRHGPSSLATGTLASTLKKARSMGSLAFPGEMGNRAAGGGSRGPLRVANRHSSDDDASDDENGGLGSDEAVAEARGLIRRKGSMAVLKEAVDAAARETEGFDALDDEAFGYSYDHVDDLGVDIPRLVEESTFIAAGGTIDEADEAEELASQFADGIDADDEQQQQLHLPQPMAASPRSTAQTVASEEGAFAYDDGSSIAPLSHLPTPVSELPPVLPSPAASTPLESSASIGAAMQTMMLDDASSSGSDDDDDDLQVAPRFPEAANPRASSPMLRAARAASMVASSPVSAGGERRASDTTHLSSRSQHPSHRLSMAWGASAVSGSSAASIRPASSYEPTYEEVRNAVMQGRRQAAGTPEPPALKSNARMSINTDLIHPEAIQKPHMPSPRAQSVALPASPSSVVAASSPAKSISKRKSFTFASPAAPIRVKTIVGARDGTLPARPARLRSSASSVNLARSATGDSPVKTRPTAAVAGSPARPMSAYSPMSSPTKSQRAPSAYGHASASGRDSPVKAGDAGSPRRSLTLHASAASPLKLAPSHRDVPALADGRASSDSGSASEVTPPLQASAFPPVPTTAAALNFADKLQYTTRHLSQHFDATFDPVRVAPRANSVDAQQPFLQSSSRAGASPSVQSKVQRLESRQTAAATQPSDAPQLRRSATTASPRYGPSDELKFVRPNHRRQESGLSEETSEALALESDLRRAPSGVSFKAPLLRHSKSMAGNPRKNS